MTAMTLVAVSHKPKDAEQAISRSPCFVRHSVVEIRSVIVFVETHCSPSLIRACKARACVSTDAKSVLA